MTRKVIALVVAVLVGGPTCADDVKLNFSKVSKLPIHAFENDEANANMMAILGGTGLKNKKGKSTNFLVIQESTFTNLKLNYYLFPNWSEHERVNYQFRAGEKRASRILSFVAKISKRNSLPTYLAGFSRGSVDAASFAKNIQTK